MTNEVTQALVHFRFDSGSSHMVDLISKGASVFLSDWAFVEEIEVC